MSQNDLASLAVIMVAAVAAVLLAGLLRKARLPGVVLEIALGIVLGPQVLRLTEETEFVGALADLGLTFLLFMAGFEVEIARIKGRPMKLAGAGWLVSLALAFAIGGIMQVEGLVRSDLYFGLALTTTALGTLLPILRDEGLLEADMGRHLLAVGAVGELGPVVAVAVLLSTGRPVVSTVLLLAFVACVLAVAFITIRVPAPHVGRLVHETLHTSGQLMVRIVVLLLVLLVLLASELGLDVLLGAFAAGLIVRRLTTERTMEHLQTRLDTLGYGFLIPIFFVVTGIRFDIVHLVTSVRAIVILVAVLLLLLVVRGLPALLYRKDLTGRQQLSLAFFSATGLPLIVVITTIGQEVGTIGATAAVAMIGAGMVSVFVYPLIGLAILRRGGGGAGDGPAVAPESTAGAGDDSSAAPETAAGAGD